MSAINPAYEDLRDETTTLAKRFVAFARSVPIGIWLAGLIVLVFVVAAVAPGLLETQNPYSLDLIGRLAPPSGAHLFGTDQLGRDVFSRVVAGARQSLLIGVGSTVLALILALALGMLAGLGGRVADAIVSRIIDVAFAFPVLFLALMVVTVYGANVASTLVAVALGTTAGYARMIRGQLIAVRDAGYVEAARVTGHPFSKIVWRHILPNALRPLLALFTLGIGNSIIWASGLSFLGLGVPPPAPEWGALLDAGRDYTTIAWWLEVMPGLAIVLLAVSVTVLGRHVQARLEGKVRANLI
jgi:peptide/nickel transport system permease protein